MADPLCRWRNFTPETIVEIVEKLPKHDMKISDFRDYMQVSWGDNFQRTVYQYACQLALYYEDGELDLYIPRFRNNISLEEAESYLRMWIHRYYVPNPYNSKSSFLNVEPKLFVQSIVDYIEVNGPDDYENIIETIWDESINNLDIVKNLLNKYSDVIVIDADSIASLIDNYQDIMNVDRFDRKAFFKQFDSELNTPSFTEIFSNTKLTTFVYSVFCELEKVDGLNAFIPFASYTNGRKDEAKVVKFQSSKLSTIASIFLECSYELAVSRNNDTASGIDRWFVDKSFNFNSKNVFLTNQWSSGSVLLLGEYVSLAYPNYKIEKEGNNFRFLKKKSSSPLDLPYQSIYYGTPGTGKSHAAKLEEAKFDKVFRTTFHPEYDYASFVGCYKPKTDIVDNTKVIIYDFDPQVFTKAYEYAWSRPEKKVLLVIEEINRGNCAQIFGDLFQLLDRDNNGESKYPINVDLDMLGYLKSKLQESHPEAVAESQIKLPGNFYIIATMNTSDQSLFPMDSAFKRRWVWKYFPITEYTQRVFKIKIAGTEYKWWDFIKEVNKRIESVTMSPDKQIGYWFINPESNVIESEEFVGKVLFYLWNDVFKDYPDNNDSPFVNIKFKDMFKVDGSPCEDTIIKFMQGLNLMINNERNTIPFTSSEQALPLAAEPLAED